MGNEPRGLFLLSQKCYHINRYYLLIKKKMEGLTATQTLIFWALLIWTIPWKGVALWKSARHRQKAWFVVLLIVNTAAILEILYLIFWQKKDKSEK